jgi:hypothetical protein
MFDDHGLRFDEDAKETYRVFPRPWPAEIPASRLLPASEDGRPVPIPPMWLTAGGLDARPVLPCMVLGEYLANNFAKFALITTAVGSGNGQLSVGVVQLVPARWLRYLDVDPQPTAAGLAP